jgi:uncharacterized protein GlcG (DUF336 family)
MISLDQARVMIAVARARGREMGLKPLSVVVLDAGGHVLAFEREDGASPGRFEIARGKAYGAVMLGMPGSAQMARAEAQAYFMAAVNGAYGGKVVPVPGGVLVKDDGAVIGAVGVTGDTSDNDAAAAVAGIEAAGFEARGVTERRLISSGSPFEAEIGYSRAVVCDGWVFVAGRRGSTTPRWRSRGTWRRRRNRRSAISTRPCARRARRWPTWCGCATSCPMARTGRPAGR